MHPIANHLLQLQDLTIIREEQRISGRKNHLEQLNLSIREMTTQLPAAVRIVFEKLQKRDSVAIAPVTGDNCSICGMKLPISLLQLIRGAKELHSCPNCARMLYVPEETPRRVAQKTRRTAPRKVGISRFSSHTLVIPRLEGADQESIIHELAGKLESEGFIVHAERLAELALRREAIASTAIEGGVAFPHVRGVEGGGLTLAVGVSKKGVAFDTVTGKKSHIFFFMVIPTAASAFYLRLLAGLAKSFEKPANRQALMNETDPEVMWKVLCRVTRTTVK